MNQEIRRLEQGRDGHSDGHSDKRDDVSPDPRSVFRSVYQSLHTPALLVDAHDYADGYGFSVLTTNYAFQELLSDGTVDVKGMNPLSFGTEKGRARVETQFCRCARQAERRVFEVDVQRNGLQGLFDVSLIPCSNEEGVEAIIGLMEWETDPGVRNGSRKESQERRFRTLFDNASIGLWEEDWSTAKDRIRELVPDEVDDLVAYFEDHPDVYWSVAKGIDVVLPNQTAVEMTGADDKQHLFDDFMEIFTEKTHEAVRHDLAALWNGEMDHSSRTKIERFDVDTDLVLMDLELPDREGVEVLRDIRHEESDRGTGNVPVIVQTALAMNQVRDDVLEAGADAFLEKPFTKSDLYRKMSAVLGRSE